MSSNSTTLNLHQSSTYKPAIVIPAFQRRNSLMRLLRSINEANIPYDDVQVVISVDGNADPKIAEDIKTFTFTAGSVDIVEHDEHLGLYKHILTCGDYSEKFGSVLVLEDDLVVAPAFYQFACRALSFYDKEDNISGIALYSQRFNETSMLPFEPLEDKWPVYFMQLGCSWGQAWTHKQWSKFRHWLANHDQSASFSKPEIPPNVQEWAASSWKKHYNHYLIHQNKYMVYPYSSFTSNCSDTIGVHMKYKLNTFQVPLNMSDELDDNFKLREFSEKSIRYDCFMEPESKVIEQWIGISMNEVEMDLTGSKTVEMLRKKKYAITPKKGRNPIRNFPLSFRPIELNLKFGSDGNDDVLLHLYKSEDIYSENSLEKSDYFKLAKYFLYIPIDSRKFATIYFKEFIYGLILRIKNFFQNND